MTPSPPNTPIARVVLSQDDTGNVDSHGSALARNDRYLWVADRGGNRIIVIDTRDGSLETRITDGGRRGELTRIARISNLAALRAVAACSSRCAARCL
jgi:hypothetical protein